MKCFIETKGKMKSEFDKPFTSIFSLKSSDFSKEINIKTI